MSSIARWSYTFKATVKPYVSVDQRTGETTYGGEYEIDCNVVAATSQDRVKDGEKELLANHIVYTEDERPKYLDLIKFDGSNGWEEIRHRTFWEMTAFNDTPDFKLTTHAS